MPTPTITLTGAALVGIAPHLDHLSKFLLAPLESQSVSVKLGKNAPSAKAKSCAVPAFANYLLAPSPPPAVIDYSPKAAAAIAKMYLNEQLGDCVIAGKYHQLGIWAGNKSGTPIVVSDQTVLSMYRVWNPGNEDNGCVITDVLDYLRNTGFPDDAGALHKIDGYVSVDWTNKLQTQIALDLFGALTLGIQLPEAWTNASIWDVTNSRIVGGHDVTSLGYNAQGIQISSWGRIYTITWNAFVSRNWLDELYVPLAPDWYGADKKAPSGFNADALKADLAMISAGGTPDPTPVAPAPTVPPPTPLDWVV